MKEGVYHVSAHHDGWEDIRENVLNYDEEGGGEEDQVWTTQILLIIFEACPRVMGSEATQKIYNCNAAAKGLISLLTWLQIN